MRVELTIHVFYGIVNCKMLEFRVFTLMVVVLLVKENRSVNYRYHPNWPKSAAKNCGESFSDRIIGGKDAALGQFPWMAQIVIYVPDMKQFYTNCGGSLISERFVLTASHCQPPPQFDLIGVILDDFDKTTDPDCDGAICAEPFQFIKIEEAFIPAPYEPETKLNDIMLLKLEKPAKLNGWVMPICLPTGLETFSNSAETAGWGMTEPNGKTSSILKFVNVPIVSRKECDSIFPRKQGPLRSSQICAGTTNRNQDSCSGDSGGPLMSIGNSEYGPRYYLIGVVSFGRQECGEYPAVYTNVSAFMPFVLSGMRL